MSNRSLGYSFVLDLYLSVLKVLDESISYMYNTIIYYCNRRRFCFRNSKHFLVLSHEFSYIIELQHVYHCKISSILSKNRSTRLYTHTRTLNSTMRFILLLPIFISTLAAAGPLPSADARPYEPRTLSTLVNSTLPSPLSSFLNQAQQRPKLISVLLSSSKSQAIMPLVSSP